jgi:hypothetical protein
MIPGTSIQSWTMPIRFVLILGLSTLLYSGCQLAQTSTAPSPLNANVTPLNTNAWSPCLVVQSPAGMPFHVQMDAAKTLQRAGKMTWIRLNARLDSSGLEYHLQARQIGMKIFSIVHLDDLEAAGWESAFDRLYATYPSDIWQIANEISNPAINRTAVTPERYMSQFKRLYDYVRNRYPGVTLASAATFGTGNSGSSELEQFFKLGLLDMDTVVAINVYSNAALSSYAAVIDEYAARLAGKRIWVAETGSSNPDNHLPWVQEFYPRVVNSVHPEMICWYALWGGDGAGGDNGFGLLDRVETGDTIERSLFKALAGER